jgi:hypothetical protein
LKSHLPSPFAALSLVRFEFPQSVGRRGANVMIGVTGQKSELEYIAHAFDRLVDAAGEWPELRLQSFEPAVDRRIAEGVVTASSKGGRWIRRGDRRLEVAGDEVPHLLLRELVEGRD